MKIIQKYNNELAENFKDQHQLHLHLSNESMIETQIDERWETQIVD